VPLIVHESTAIHTTTRLRVTMFVLLGKDCGTSERTCPTPSSVACVPGPLCAEAQADAKSFVEIPAIAEIDDAADCMDR
jgi:hypothetical protein